MQFKENPQSTPVQNWGNFSIIRFLPYFEQLGIKIKTKEPMKTTWTQTYAPFRQYAKTVFYIMNIFESQYSICTRFYNLHVKD